MYTRWTAHCSNEHEKAQLEADVRRAKPVLERLLQILSEEEEVLESRSLNESSFESPSWPYLQASILGKRSGYNYIKKLIDLDKQKDTKNEHSTG